MRKLVASVVAAAALLIAGMGNAAPVDVVFTRTSATTWDLTMVVTDPIVGGVTQIAFNILTSPVSDFTINPAQYPANIDNFTSSVPSGFSVKNSPAANTLHIAMVAGTGGFIAGGALNVLGTLNAVGLSQCFGAELGNCAFFSVSVDDGGTILDGDFGEVASTVRFVPEPAVMVLLGLGLAGLGLVRRSA